MTEPYLFERGIGQQMGDLCRLAVGDAKVTQTGEIVTLEDMLARGVFGVSVEVPYTEGGVQSVSVTRCGKNLFDATATPSGVGWAVSYRVSLPTITYCISSSIGLGAQGYRLSVLNRAGQVALDRYPLSNSFSYTATTSIGGLVFGFQTSGHNKNDIIRAEVQLELGDTATAYEPYNGDTYTITLPADFYGGSISLAAGTVTSLYASDGTELAEPVITEIDPISIPILAGVNNVWADVGTVTVSYYPADTQGYRPALWYPTIYRGLTSARYLIKRASGAIASFSDAVAAPLVGLRVALPYDAEGYQSVSVTRCGKNLLNWQLPTSQFTDLVFTLGINGRTTLRISGILSTPTVQGAAFISYVLNGNTRYRAWGDVSIPVVLRFDGNLSSITILNWGGIRGTIEEAQLELGSTATAYEPYNGDTYTITLPATIYGGYLDVVTGQLIATHDEKGNLLANQKLYFLPPTNINALAGVNNVWSDAGDVAVSYRIDNG